MKIGRYLVVVLIAMMLLIVFGKRGVVDNYLIGKRIDQLKLQKSMIAAESDELKKKIFLLRGDLNYIESIARNELGMVKKGDVVYRLLK
jgi:cell division protein FtsB